MPDQFRYSALKKGDISLKGLVLAEKPSLMRAIQSAYKSEPPASFGFDLDFAAFHGHLMALAQPADYNPDWKKWKTEDLPIIPEPFKYVPSDGESIRKILGKISAGHYDFVKRLWSSTTVEADLRKALHGLRDYSETELVNLRSSSKFRAEFDWLAGMNFSRAVALKTGKKVNIGRVVTPTLKIVVDRENEIRSFKPEKFSLWLWIRAGRSSRALFLCRRKISCRGSPNRRMRKG